MQKTISIKVLPSEASDNQLLTQIIAKACAVPAKQVTGFNLQKQSIDARGRQAWFHLTIEVFINEPFRPTPLLPLQLRDVSRAAKTVVIVGAGPAGLFAALRLIELGIKPVILERGKDVRSRRRDLAAINKEGVVNTESNYCFGEGGAGTYSDGKLYTRSTKRGDIFRILSALVHFGATEAILYQAHPHIGTNKLPQIITSMREKIIEYGGEVRFEKKLTALIVEKETVTGVHTADGDSLHADAVILATGHSARDIFLMLHAAGIRIEAKPFALGVRVEHPQPLIDTIQYHCPTRSIHLPPAAYSLVQQVNGKGVFSFCMCPGGIIAPAATSKGEIVVNGWSPSKRNNPYANSGIVVSVEEKDTQAFKKHGPLAAMYFQQSVEQKAFEAGGGSLAAPAQRLEDFSRGIVSASLPDCSYLPGIRSADLGSVLPSFVHRSLQEAFVAFGKKMKGYFTNEAVVVATESRTSSPVRIPRDTERLEHPQVKRLYPCGEGAGYAGGIVSAAMDGEKVAEAIARVLSL
ncbi:MAG TPA: FAD-binding protein [Flavisolibacter sp.]|nr:FAD-binding protein [Flavisolibacter sp.]